MIDGNGDGRRFSEEELKSLFEPNFDSRSNAHDRSKCQCHRQPPHVPRVPDANGLLHALPGSSELTTADPPLAAAASSTGRLSLAYLKVTDKSGRGFASPESRR